MEGNITCTREFNEWCNRKGYKMNETHPSTPLKKGDFVVFTNEYGYTFGPYQIMGFHENLGSDNEHFVFLNYDCYWFPVTLRNIKKYTNN